MPIRHDNESRDGFHKISYNHARQHLIQYGQHCNKVGMRLQKGLQILAGVQGRIQGCLFIMSIIYNFYCLSLPH